MPAPTEDEIKQHLQRHLQRGLVTIVGSGMSCAEGLPGMGELATRLQSLDPISAGVAVEKLFWTTVVETIRTNGLEIALHRLAIDDALADFLRKETAAFLLEREAAVVREVFAEKRTLQLTKLFAYLPHDVRLQFITTNYDRLIELAAELAGFKVDTKSLGLYHAKFSKTGSAYAFCDRIDWHKRAPRLVEQKVLSLYKPHGSLDWMLVNGVAIRSGFPPDPSNCLIITPGQNKYRAGYNQPFDMQRELANRAVDEAQRFLIIGYGFNDDHLETHLSARIQSGVPTVIMTRSLTDNAKAITAKNPDVMALEANPTDDNSTVVHFLAQRTELENQIVWNPDGFVREVMGA